MRRLFFLILLIPAPAMAGAAYKCTAANGAVIYQDAPCAKGQRQEMLDLPQDLGPAPAPASTSDASTQAPATPPAPRPSPPATPLPAMFVCLKATDGKSYISENGDPQPYLVPFGILGAAPRSLSQVYGPGGGGGASAPELNRGKTNPNLVGNNFVWVQDQCRPLSFSETCNALRDAYDDVEHKLQRAFKSDQPPLEKREAQLLSQLAQCNG
ncbi:DUF4124 domain-containing protein [Dyella sp. GSA-30]|uniref:DUF4124 domain-containing protein n=1 Tax=Dyella sp. GSA-30 TaxID=2994496 RepID=UPI0024905DB5|nr:DUF4124 domain-containing protein [Dyella sp. GSA-30]BDU18766.1 hypothetical protein DYGSA30_02230 [Dyella sp. GSA-30]